ncbi:MAG: glycosyltransferase family 4 protein [Gemmatimonadaceae bacterium]
MIRHAPSPLPPDRLRDVKVGLVTMRTDPARGGAERYTVELAAALTGAGHDVALLAAETSHVPRGVRGVRIDASGWTRLGRYERFLHSLESHLDREPFEIVHAMLPTRRCDLYHPHAGILRATTARDTAFDRWRNPRRARVAAVERDLLESGNPPVVLCLSEYVRAAARQWYDLDETKLPILFNSVDTARYDPSARPDARVMMRRALRMGDDDIMALFIGHDFERKGLREAIRALSGLRDAPVKLVIVGRPRAAKYLALARDLGVADRVVLAGETGDSYAMYSAADYLVLPTRHDPCSLVVLEALVMGVPVISTRYNGACEIMNDGVHGFVMEWPDDVTALSNAMRRLGDPALRERMSEACLALRPRLAYARHLRAALAIYDRVVAARH